jgi:NAD(P)-dependent dehydrogenase (short-subunit alcohol dehydrogenase family)
MAREGASVIVNDPGAGRNGVTTERPADEVVAEIAKAGGDALADTFGKIDFVVNAAGVLRERMIWNMTEDDFDAVISVHLKGTWNMRHHAIKLMRGRRFGRIVNFSSDAFKGSVGQCNYAAAKAGVIGQTRTIARECGRYGITANAMCPFAHVSDDRHLAWLLRARRERPRRRAAKQRDESAPFHSITSSARASTVVGISRPSAFAVFRLTTNSYLFGACTGRSAGFSPLRMRST